jgi:hypothetical protein
VIRETGPQLDEIKVRMHRLYPKLAGKPAWNGDGHGRWTWPSGARVILESIATPEDVEKIQGKEPSVIFHDEVGNVQDERSSISNRPSSARPIRASSACGAARRIPARRATHGSSVASSSRAASTAEASSCARSSCRTAMEARLSRRFIPGTVLDNPIYANDPLYMAQLATLPEVLRRQLLYGDWNAGSARRSKNSTSTCTSCAVRGAGLLDALRLVRLRLRAQLGVDHFAADEDGNVYVVDTVRGRRHQVHQIAERVLSRVPVFHPNYRYTHTDSYAFQSKKERDENTPTIAETDEGSQPHPLARQHRSQEAGLHNLRYYLAWRGIGPMAPTACPRSASSTRRATAGCSSSCRRWSSILTTWKTC